MVDIPYSWMGTALARSTHQIVCGIQVFASFGTLRVRAPTLQFGRTADTGAAGCTTLAPLQLGQFIAVVPR
jgi:hypothetical protein